MRFLHISDLHLGKKLHDLSMIDDQKKVLSQLAQDCVREKVEVVLIAGDIYQNSVPSEEAMQLFDSFLSDLVREGIRVFMISGNHDSDVRISYFSSLIKAAGIFACESFEGVLQSVEVCSEPKICIHMLPFIKPIHVRRFFPDETIETYEDAVRTVLDHSPVDPQAVNILMCHQTVSGAQKCDSEEPVIGGVEAVDHHVFDAFDYVAMGHLHGEQYIGRKEVRYCGSLLKYSLSEMKHEKGGILLDVEGKGKLSISKLPFMEPHPMREVRGTLEEIMAMPVSMDYVRVVLTDEIVVPDAASRVLQIFPQRIDFRIENSKVQDVQEFSDVENVEQKGTIELFDELYRLLNNQTPLSEEHKKVLQEIIEEMGTEETL